MKQNKLVIVALVVVAVLFILGLSSGFFRDTGQNDNELTMSKAQSYKKGWIASLKGMMSSTRTPLDSGRLPKKAKRTNPNIPGPDINLGADGTVVLGNELEYAIEIAPSKDDEDLESVILTVAGGRTSLKVAYPGTGDCPKPRGMGVALKKFKTPKVAAGIGKIKQPKVTGNFKPPEFELIVAYTPADIKKAEEEHCQKVEQVDIAVLKDGGTIKMKCTGCNRQKKKTIRVKLQ